MHFENSLKLHFTVSFYFQRTLPLHSIENCNRAGENGLKSDDAKKNYYSNEDNDLENEFQVKNIAKFREYKKSKLSVTPGGSVDKNHFTSDSEIHAFLKELQTNHQQFWTIRDSQPKKKITTDERRNANPKLQHYTLLYKCAFGAQQPSKGAGLRNAK